MAGLPLPIQEKLLEIVQHPLAFIFGHLRWAMAVISQLCGNIAFVAAIVIATATSVPAFLLLVVHDLFRFIFRLSSRFVTLAVKTVQPARACEDFLIRRLPEVAKEALDVFIWCFVIVLATHRASRIFQPLADTAQDAFLSSMQHQILGNPSIWLLYSLLVRSGLWPHMSKAFTWHILLPFAARCALIVLTWCRLSPPTPTVTPTTLLKFGRWFWIFLSAPHKCFGLLIASLLDLFSWILDMNGRLITAATLQLTDLSGYEAPPKLGEYLIVACATLLTFTLASCKLPLLPSRAAFTSFMIHLGYITWYILSEIIPISLIYYAYEPIYVSEPREIHSVLPIDNIVNHLLAAAKVSPDVFEVKLTDARNKILSHLRPCLTIEPIDSLTPIIRKYIMIFGVLLTAVIALRALNMSIVEIAFLANMGMRLRSLFGPEIHIISKSFDYIYTAISCISVSELREEDLSLVVRHVLTRICKEMLIMSFFFFSEALLLLIFCIRLPFLVLSSLVHQLIYSIYVLSTLRAELSAVFVSIIQLAIANIIPVASTITAVWITIIAFILMVGIPAFSLLALQFMLQRLYATVFTITLLSNYLLPNIVNDMQRTVCHSANRSVEAINGVYETVLNDPFITVRLLRSGVRLAARVAVHDTNVFIAGVCVSNIAINFVVVGVYDALMLEGGKLRN